MNLNPKPESHSQNSRAFPADQFPRTWSSCTLPSTLHRFLQRKSFLNSIATKLNQLPGGTKMKVERRERRGGGSSSSSKPQRMSVRGFVYWCEINPPRIFKNFRPQKRIRLREWPNLGVASAAGLPCALHFWWGRACRFVLVCLQRPSGICFLGWSDVDVDAQMYGYYHSSSQILIFGGHHKMRYYVLHFRAISTLTPLLILGWFYQGLKGFALYTEPISTYNNSNILE